MVTVSPITVRKTWTTHKKSHKPIRRLNVVVKKTASLLYVQSSVVSHSSLSSDETDGYGTEVVTSIVFPPGPTTRRSHGGDGSDVLGSCEGIRMTTEVTHTHTDTCTHTHTHTQTYTQSGFWQLYIMTGIHCI